MFIVAEMSQLAKTGRVRLGVNELCNYGAEERQAAPPACLIFFLISVPKLGLLDRLDCLGLSFWVPFRVGGFSFWETLNTGWTADRERLSDMLE